VCVKYRCVWSCVYPWCLFALLMIPLALCRFCTDDCCVPLLSSTCVCRQGPAFRLAFACCPWSSWVGPPVACHRRRSLLCLCPVLAVVELKLLLSPLEYLGVPSRCQPLLLRPSVKKGLPLIKLYRADTLSDEH